MSKCLRSKKKYVKIDNVYNIKILKNALVRFRFSCFSFYIFFFHFAELQYKFLFIIFFSVVVVAGFVLLLLYGLCPIYS